MSDISRTVLRDQVKSLLVARILGGELRPGDPLVETRIAQELGMSQAPIREALRDLELLRLVESEPFKTARVRELSDHDLLEVFPVRAALEELAARTVASDPDIDLAPVRAELEEMRRAASAGDIREQLSHDIRFHRAIVEATGNQALLSAWLAVGIEAATAFGTYHTMWEPMQLVAFHEPILEALEQRDARKAVAEARNHVRRTERVVAKRVRERARRAAVA
jgi:DNA-binding GntR family transcriptional regulator